MTSRESIDYLRPKVKSHPVRVLEVLSKQDDAVRSSLITRHSISPQDSTGWTRGLLATNDQSQIPNLSLRQAQGRLWACRMDPKQGGLPQSASPPSQWPRVQLLPKSKIANPESKMETLRPRGLQRAVASG